MIDLSRETYWVCPNCNMTDVTYQPLPHSRFHNCPGLKGFSAPMVEAGVKCKIEAREREDFLRGDLPQVDGEGTPIMSVVTTREDGEDCVVYAPTSTARTQ